MGAESDARRKHQVYLDQREALIDMEVGSAKSFDHWIMTLSAGALGLSITFIGQIAPHPPAGTYWLLAVSWVFLLLGILSGLCSHLTSQSAMRRQRAILDAEFELRSLRESVDESSEGGADEQKNHPAVATHVLNIAAMAFFALGVILLGGFSLCNFPKGGRADVRAEESSAHTSERGGSAPQTGQTTAGAN